ncbi:hybrid sensor histidine kinase/response regulator transcription factor [Dyadobacter tibetensis]|uniref:hybrid sensor histidine kinase/response regulator transcription factor n=1 Tax=Dyadobacter tibetensis TaxID=1211851 RepID=UPI0004729B58|nr:two-component regulator propeller domain-containing protein [Dyadobacter tibetensis]
MTKTSIHKIIFQVVFVWAIGYAIPANSQKPTRLVKTKNIQSDNGKIFDTVVSIASDSLGFLWYATPSGLYRYDSHQFRKFDKSDGLYSNYVKRLFTDSKGDLWVGTYNGLNRFDTSLSKFEKYIYDDHLKNGSAPNDVFSIHEDKSGKIWVGTVSGLYKLNDRKTGTFIKKMSNQAVFSIASNSNGELWVASERGLVNMTIDGITLATYQNEPHNPKSLKSNMVKAVYVDPNNTLWVGTYDGTVSRFNRKEKTFNHIIIPDPSHNFQSFEVNTITSGAQGSLWVGTNNGAYNINISTNHYNHYIKNRSDSKAISENYVYSIFDNELGQVWVGTYNYGINLLERPHVFNFFPEEADKKDSDIGVVNCFTKDKTGNWWVGTESEGISVIDGNTKQIRPIPKINQILGSNRVFTIFPDKDGKMWIGTYTGGLSQFDPINKSWRTFRHNSDSTSISSNDIRSILRDSKNRLWIGTSSGIDLYNEKNQTFQHYFPRSKNQYTFTIFEDSNKNIWFSTQNGSFYLDHNDKVRPVRILSPISNVPDSQNYALCFQEDLSGNIWAGTFKEGLKKFNPLRGAFESYKGVKELTQGSLSAIQVDRAGNLWLAYLHSLKQLNINSNRVFTYSSSDGVYNSAYNWNASWKDNTSGKLYFGTSNGILYFNPADVQINQVKPKVILTELEIDGQIVLPMDSTNILEKSIAFTSRIDLEHTQNFITIDFAVLNYLRSDKNQFSYKLEGADSKWRPLSKPSVTFNNLLPGTYTLFIKGANNDNTWSIPTSLEIVIKQPFWKRWWAIVIYAFLLIGLILLIVRFFWIRMTFRQAAIAHQAKLDFFSNISHEIRTHLSLISGPLEKILEIRKDDYKIAPFLIIARNNTSRLTSLVGELLDFTRIDDKKLKLKVSEYEVVSFMKNALSVFDHLCQEKGITITLKSNMDSIYIWADQFQLEKVVYNLLSNAIKYIDRGDNIKIRIEQLEKTVKIDVIDNGLGISAKNLKYIFENYFQVADELGKNSGYGLGLALSRKIIDLHHGNLKVKSIPATHDSLGYTCFSIILLRGKEHFSEAELVENQSVNQVNVIAGSHKSLSEIDENDTDNDWIKEQSILIVEDNPQLRDLLRLSLHQTYRIYECEDGEEGLQRALEILPNIIISDVMMPGMNGLELCHAIKTHITTSHIPIILLTAKASNEDIQQGYHHLADHYIVKPFSMIELELRIRNILNHNKILHEKLNHPSNGLYYENVRMNNIDQDFLAKMASTIEENLTDPQFNVITLCKNIGISRPVLYRKIKALTGMSINEFARTVKLKKAACLLRTTNYNVNEVSELVGFSDRKYFSKEFKKMFKMNPSEYIKVP